MDASFVDARWVWSTAAQDESSSTGASTYRGGAVVDEVGGCCGSFLCAPCPEGVTIEEVRVSFATADGWIDHAFTGTFTGPGEFSGVQFQSAPVPLAAVGGSLATQMFELDGEPFVPASVELLVTWGFVDGELVLEEAFLLAADDDGGAFMGSYAPL